jgi:hypothetical protein
MNDMSNKENMHPIIIFDRWLDTAELQAFTESGENRPIREFTEEDKARADQIWEEVRLAFQAANKEYLNS